MLRPAAFAIFAPLLFASAVPSHAQAGGSVPPGYRALPAAEAAAVREVLSRYLDAVRRHDGATAVQAVTRDTRAYYARMHDLAMTAPEAQVRALPLVDRVSVLMYRHRVPTGVLHTLSGDSAFAYTISEGWVDRTARWQPSTAAPVFANGDRAILRDSGMDVQLVREAGAWRWNMLPILQAANAQFTASIPAGMSENEFIMLVLRSSSGRPATATVWQPVQPRQ